MTVTADSYESKALELAINMLCASASFQALTGAASAAAARAFVVETDSGAPQDVNGEIGAGIAASGAELDLAVPPYAIVGLEPGVARSLGGVGYFDYEFGIVIRLILARRADGETPPDSSRRAWNVTGQITDQINAQVGGPDALGQAEAKSEGIFKDEEGVHRDHLVTQITINAQG